MIISHQLALVQPLLFLNSGPSKFQVAKDSLNYDIFHKIVINLRVSVYINKRTSALQRQASQREDVSRLKRYPMAH